MTLADRSPADRVAPPKLPPTREHTEPIVRPAAGDLRRIMAGLMLALTLAALDQNIVATALPRIVSDFGGLAHLSWVVTAFMVASTTTTPLYGKLSDIYGRKPAFIVSIALFLAGSALCGLANSMTQLIAFRALQGLGAGGLITLAQTTIGDVIPVRERGRYQGLFSAVFAGCSVAGPLLGGFITDALSWRWIFYVNLPVGAVALALIMLSLPSAKIRANRPVDYAGASLLIAATCCALLVLSWGGSIYPWSSWPVCGLSLATLLLIAGVAAVERRAREPILPPRLFRNTVFVVSVLGISFATMAMFGALVFLPLFFQVVLGASPSLAGLMIAPMMGGVIVSSFVGGRLVSATGLYKWPVIGGMAAATLSLAWLAWATRSSGSVLAIEFALVVLGLGVGFANPNLTTAIQNAVGRRDLGAATSASAFFRSFGGAIGVAISGGLLTGRLNSLLPARLASALKSADLQAALHGADRVLAEHAYRDALSITFLAGAMLAALAFAIVLLLPERRLRRAGE